ncbi:lipoprotein [Allosphingosinicella sp.]|uniref:lipoprotein n=1 Tax=Allosphingosinicella sp. TaxID=2823234 RepID=UPI002F1A898D
MTRTGFAIAAVLLLAACGVRAPLEPAPGAALPVAPETATRAQTADELLEGPPIARPARVDEALTRSEEREEDRFDLPPQ